MNTTLNQFDEELTKLIGVEVSAEFLTSMKITTIDEYRKLVKDDKDVSKNKVNRMKKKIEEKNKLSKTKMKANIRKKEMVMNKKMKNEMRGNILESLEKHKSIELDLLDSAKNLGKKRKKSKDKLIVKETEDFEEEIIDDKMDINIEEGFSSDDSDFINDVSNPNKNQSQNPNSDPNANPDPNANTNLPSKTSFEIDPEFLSSLLAEKRLNRINEGLLIDLEDDPSSSMTYNLEIPDKSRVILVTREAQIQTERINLPIVKYEHEIMDKINNSLVTVICGETGSGKSTQIPQFLYEYGYTATLGAIVVTQPRRVAAVSLATRVAKELNTKLGEQVGYQVRYDSKHYSDATVIKYLTDGILLKELESDKLLLKYSVVIIDEAHERTINTDIIIGLLSKLVKTRYMLSKNKVRLTNRNNENNKTDAENYIKPLRLVIMSATMRVDEFLTSHIFKPNIIPSFIKIDARQFPVTIHHAKRTSMDYIDEAFKLCCKIHHKLPIGGVLIFLTGKREIQQLCEMLNSEFENKVDYSIKDEESNEVNLDNLNKESNEIKKNNESKERLKNNIQKDENIKKENNNKDSKIKINEDIIFDTHTDSNLNIEANILNDVTNLNDDDDEEKLPTSYKPYIILPLYSSLPQDQQMKIFESIPANKRLIVIATNVAETSLTIPNIRYVIDSGRAKKRVFTSGLSFSTFQIEWISQASAEQRGGRAGRTGPGYCYRLFSNGLYAKMDKYTEPQIVSSPLDQMVLYLKSLNINDISKFPFLTFPSKKFVEKTLRHLLVIGGLKSDEDSEYNIVKTFINLKEEEKGTNENIDYKDNTNITDVGKLMVKFPVQPKYGKIIILANKLGLLEYAIVLVAVMNLENLFTSEISLNKKNKFEDELAEGDKNSDKNEKIEKNINNEKIEKIEKNVKNDIRSIIENKLLNPFSDEITYTNLILTLLKLDYTKTYILNQFCLKYHLNIKQIKEMLDIIEQIIKISKSIFCSTTTSKLPNGQNTLSMLSYKSLAAPDANQQNLLIQAVLSGFIDNLARRRVIYDLSGNEKDNKIENKNKTATRKVIYECNENNEECQLHPNSVVAKSNPDFIIYKESIKDKKTFLICNTVIKPEWVYNLGGDIVSSNLVKDSLINEPFYEKESDLIYCYVDVKYGYKNWDMPKVKVQMNREHENYFYYLARFILEGKIFKEFAEYERFLNAKPKIITAQISILPKVTMFVNSLKFAKVYNREGLVQMWKKRRTFLLDAYLNWFEDSKMKEKIKIKWPLVKI